MARIENRLGIPEDELERQGLIDRLSQYLAAEPKAWHVRYNLGLALMREGRSDEAVVQFRQVLQESPKHLESLVNLGGIHLARGEADQALKAFTSALSVWDLPLVRANLAVAYLQLGHLAEAERELQRALAANPAMAEAWANLASLCLQDGRPAEAEEACRRALAVLPEFALAHNNLAAALWELGRPEEAARAAARAVELGYPVHPELRARLGLPAV